MSMAGGAPRHENPRETGTPAGAAAARRWRDWIQSSGMGGVGTEIVVVLVLLLANGVFAMSEISIVAARKVRLQQRADDGDRMAKAALALANAPTQFLSTVQIGISLVGVLAGAYGGATIAESLQARLEQIPSVAPYAEGLALGLVVAVITYLSLIIGELVPKRIGLNHPETIASWVAIPMMGLARIGAPLVALLTGSTNLVLRIFGIKGQIDPHLTEDEIRAVISQGAESGALASEEESLVQRVFRVGDQRVGAIMTPRLDIEWVDANATSQELREFLGGHSHGQFVVGKASLDNVLGTVRAADLLTTAMKGAPINLKALVQEPLFVPDSMGIFKLLEALKTSHRHMAIVLDEFGAVEGLVTVTDLLEAFVGSLPTDHADERAIVSRPDGSWLVDGATPIDDVVNDLGLEELPEDEAGAYHTLGGFVMARLGRIPRTADSFEWSGMRFEVVDMDARRIDKVLVNRLAPAEAAVGEVND
jgi:putative hemolysin